MGNLVFIICGICCAYCGIKYEEKERFEYTITYLTAVTGWFLIYAGILDAIGMM